MPTSAPWSSTTCRACAYSGTPVAGAVYAKVPMAPSAGNCAMISSLETVSRVLTSNSYHTVRSSRLTAKGLAVNMPAGHV